MRDNTDIALEIDKLKKYKPLIPPKTMWGDDNLSLIDAEIAVLESVMNDSAIDRKFRVNDDEDGEQRVLDAAMGAYDWKMGRVDEAPSANWHPLVEKKLHEKDEEDEVEEKETSDGWYCPSCEKGWENSDELEPIYECGSCGSTFNRDNSADGSSNRCPDCNKFAAKLSDHGCPDCGDIECEEGKIVKGEDDEWKMAEDGD